MGERFGRGPDEERRARLWSQVRRLAADEGVAVGVRHVCATAAIALQAADIVVYQVVDHSRSEPVAVTSPVADQMSEAEITFGEGPAIDAMREEFPALVGDLDTGAHSVRWPVFTPFALSGGVLSVSAFPVMMGAIVVGCLEAHRRFAGGWTAEQVVDGLLLADAAMLLLLRSSPPVLGVDPFADAVEARWAIVHQATGMASAQLGVDLATAFIRLRAHAYRTGLRLADVAAAVLARRLRFEPEPGVEPDTERDPDQG